MNKLANEIMMQIFKGNIWEGFDANEHEFDKHGWWNSHTAFNDVIPVLRPKVYIELGVWKGLSTRAVAKLFKENGLEESAIIAVDTWLGSTEHWNSSLKSKTRLGALDLKNGYPQFYYTFLANCVHSGHSDMIVPFPTTTANALRYLVKNDIKADLVYIDGSHEYEDVLTDLVLTERVLRDENSIIIGDDMSPWFPGVGKAVKEFRSEKAENQWNIQKDGYGYVLQNAKALRQIKITKPPKKIKKEKKA